MDIATAALARGEASPYCNINGEADRAVIVLRRLTCCVEDKNEGNRDYKGLQLGLKR